jgi:hypothetical protein
MRLKAKGGKKMDAWEEKKIKTMFIYRPMT